jgi:hypothetical protein
MATTKKRINITLPPLIEDAVIRMAKNDSVPVATKASELLEFALAIEEDIVLDDLAKTRDSKVKFISHEKAWL